MKRIYIKGRKSKSANIPYYILFYYWGLDMKMDNIFTTVPYIKKMLSLSQHKDEEQPSAVQR